MEAFEFVDVRIGTGKTGNTKLYLGDHMQLLNVFAPIVSLARGQGWW